MCDTKERCTVKWDKLNLEKKCEVKPREFGKGFQELLHTNVTRIGATDITFLMFFIHLFYFIYYIWTVKLQFYKVYEF